MLYQERCYESRKLFLERLKDVEPERLVYVDESGLEQNFQRQYGYCLRGKRLLGERSGKRFVERHSVIAGFCQGKFMAPWVFKGYCDTEVVLTWVQGVLVPELKAGQIVVMDNASFHKSLLIREVIEAAGCELWFLPAYSPDLNPIEQAWAGFKAWLAKMACPLLSLLTLVDLFFRKSN
jgi:DDE superfamily endonuclease